MTIAQNLHVTARQVAFVLATLTAKESKRLPRFRVVAANGVAPDNTLLADSHVEGRPTVNDMATLLAHAMRRSAGTSAWRSDGFTGLLFDGPMFPDRSA